MAESKISELHQIQSLSEEDEFVVIDKSSKSGDDASSTGKTSKATMQQLRDGMFPDGAAAGEKGHKGEKGNAGNSGEEGHMRVNKGAHGCIRFSRTTGHKR